MINFTVSRHLDSIINNAVYKLQTRGEHEDGIFSFGETADEVGRLFFDIW